VGEVPVVVRRAVNAAELELDALAPLASARPERQADLLVRPAVLAQVVAPVASPVVLGKLREDPDPPARSAAGEVGGVGEADTRQPALRAVGAGVVDNAFGDLRADLLQIAHPARRDEMDPAGSVVVVDDEVAVEQVLLLGEEVICGRGLVRGRRRTRRRRDAAHPRRAPAEGPGARAHHQRQECGGRAAGASPLQ
jgi:hypothetical protein